MQQMENLTLELETLELMIPGYLGHICRGHYIKNN